MLASKAVSNSNVTVVVAASRTVLEEGCMEEIKIV